MGNDDWLLMTDCWLSSHGKRGWHGCPQADGGGEQVLIKDEGLMMTEDLMDYILSGYKLYENKGETWKYGQVLTKIQNKIVSLQQICDDFG